MLVGMPKKNMANEETIYLYKDMSTKKKYIGRKHTKHNAYNGRGISHIEFKKKSVREEERRATEKEKTRRERKRRDKRTE